MQEAGTTGMYRMTCSITLSPYAGNLFWYSEVVVIYMLVINPGSIEFIHRLWQILHWWQLHTPSPLIIHSPDCCCFGECSNLLYAHIVASSSMHNKYTILLCCPRLPPYSPLPPHLVHVHPICLQQHPSPPRSSTTPSMIYWKWWVLLKFTQLTLPISAPMPPPNSHFMLPHPSPPLSSFTTRLPCRFSCCWRRNFTFEPPFLVQVEYFLLDL